jgi:hypothetical protein
MSIRRNNISFALLALCLALPVAPSVSHAQQGNVVKRPFLTEENQKFSQDYKKRLLEALAGPYAQMQLDNKGNELLEAEIATIRFITENSDKKAECLKKSIEFIRQCYIKSDFKRSGPTYVGSGNLITPGTVPVVLYLYTGETRALFEYTMLSGMYATEIDAFWDNNRKWNDTKLLEYRIYALDQGINHLSNRYLMVGEISAEPNSLRQLTRLVNDFGAETPAVKRTLFNFAFNDRAYIKTSIEMHKLGVNVIPSTKQLLTDYYTTLVKGTSWEEEFLAQVEKEYSPELRKALKAKKI